MSFPFIGSKMFWSKDFFVYLEYLIDKTSRDRPFNRKITISKDFNKLLNLLRPKVCAVESPKGYYNRTICEIAQLDMEQYNVIDCISSNKRIIYDSYAGTGKTVLALEFVKRYISEGKKVLLVTYNKLINKYFKKHFPPSEMLRVCTISALNPKNMCEFDTLIIDEAQDVIYNNTFLKNLNIVLKGGLQKGNWVWLGDFKLQTIFDLDNQINISDFQNEYNASYFTNKKSYRNPDQIIATCNFVFKTDYKQVRGDNQHSIHIHYYNSKKFEEEHEIINNVIEECLTLGFDKTDIVILSAKSNNVGTLIANNITNKFDKDIKAYDLDVKDLRYSSIRLFKGLESPIVILTSIEEGIPGEFIYIGLTRALNRIYILGDGLNQTVSKIDNFLSLKSCGHKKCEVKDLIYQYNNPDSCKIETIESILGLNFDKMNSLDKLFLQSFYKINQMKIKSILIELIEETIEEDLGEFLEEYIQSNSGDIIIGLECEGSIDIELDYIIPKKTSIEVYDIIDKFCRFSNFDHNKFIEFFNKNVSPYETCRSISFNFNDEVESSRPVNFKIEYSI
ncbi:hypothetical protein [Bacillus cereus]|uniref:hypothetical protein n=1 Tax=Bacillus cereus TaxID=1396 RepID=UPI00065BBBF2|nr:hypothetical protein [Bacillus cereus]KMP50166.1 hypothetical protein TU59_23340 [Bacillus cereus]